MFQGPPCLQGLSDLDPQQQDQKQQLLLPTQFTGGEVYSKKILNEKQARKLVNLYRRKNAHFFCVSGT